MAAEHGAHLGSDEPQPGTRRGPMHVSRIAITVVLFAVSTGAKGATGQTSIADQIDRALLAAPETLREDATVLGYGGDARAGDPLTVLRAGSNHVICLADDPARDGFHVACYHDSLDPFMIIGRRIKADGGDRATILAARYAALEQGRIEAPAAALWSLSGAVAMIVLFVGVSIPMIEKKLDAGKRGYAEYRAHTPMLLPWGSGTANRG